MHQEVGSNNHLQAWGKLQGKLNQGRKKAKGVQGQDEPTRQERQARPKLETGNCWKPLS
jgi:hypothetical protein